jgi:hypothetical protein
MTRARSKKPVRLSKKVADDDTVERAETDLRRGKSASSAAGEFVREEIDHIREGKHGARSAKQAIAIGLSKARRAGVPLPAPKRGKTSERTRKQAQRELQAGPKRSVSAKRSRAATEALEREPESSVSKRALSTQARRAAAKRRRSGAVTPRAKRKTARRG